MLNRSLNRYITVFAKNFLDLISVHGPKKTIDDQDYLKINANFLYTYSLLDRLLGDIIKIGIKHNKRIKENYIALFNSLAEQKIKDNNQERDWKIFFNQPDVMINHYRVIEKEKSQIVMAKVLFELNMKDEQLNTIFKEYNEIRERRNLLIHRGKKPDSLYS